MATPSSLPSCRLGSRRSRSPRSSRARSSRARKAHRPKVARLPPGKARAARRNPPSPELLLADDLGDSGSNRLDVRLEDVAAPIAAITLEGDERRLDEEVADLRIGRAARDLEQRRQVVERQIGLQ